MVPNRKIKAVSSNIASKFATLAAAAALVGTASPAAAQFSPSTPAPASISGENFIEAPSCEINAAGSLVMNDATVYNKSPYSTQYTALCDDNPDTTYSIKLASPLPDGSYPVTVSGAFTKNSTLGWKSSAQAKAPASVQAPASLPQTQAQAACTNGYTARTVMAGTARVQILKRC